MALDANPAAAKAIGIEGTDRSGKPLRHPKTSDRGHLCAVVWRWVQFLSRSANINPQKYRYNGAVRFCIRQFRKPDLDTLWEIDQACFDPQLAYSRPELAFYIRRPGSFTLVAEAADVQADDQRGGNGGSLAEAPESPAKILGFIVAENRRGNGHIITIDVIAEARRSGVGSSLLRAAEEKLVQAGTGAVALETPVNNLTAIRFYKREGYFVEKTVAGYYSGLLDALVMTKDLARIPT